MADDFEKSHGKPRPTLLRRTDVQPHIPRTAHERLQGRASDGTATSGNQLALGRGWKSTIRKTIAGAVKAMGAQSPSENDTARIVADAAVVYMAILRDAPISGPLMRLNAAGVAREFAVASYLDAKATEAGLLTETGATLAERASFHRQRAERLSVTTHALSQRARGKRRGKSFVEQATAEIAAEKNNAD